MGVPIEDNGEPMLYAPEAMPSLQLRYPKYTEDETPEVKRLHHFLRSGLVERLQKAETMLPEGVSFQLVCGYRPLYIQKKRYAQVTERIQGEHPDWTAAQVKLETDKWIAPLELVPPHSTGSAMDLTLCRNGEPLAMGTEIGEANEKSPFESALLTPEERANRALLADALTSVGFINYYQEWWHWSYGDRYWALATKAPYSTYDSVDLHA